MNDLPNPASPYPAVPEWMCAIINPPGIGSCTSYMINTVIRATFTCDNCQSYNSNTESWYFAVSEMTPQP